MKEELRAKAKELGFDDCRVTTAAAPVTAKQFQEWLAKQNHGEMAWLQKNAFKRVDPSQVLQNARSVITLAISYHDQQAQTGPVARYARYADYHDVLAEPLKTLTAWIDALAGPGTRSLWYVDTGPFLERDLAQRAGIGFVGKHTNLISRDLGNWIFLAEIITTAEIEPDAPEKNHCGKCARCIAICPTNAIEAPFQLNARKCISYLTIELKGSIPEELRPAIGNRIYGCDECLAVCPWNRFAKEANLMRPHRREELSEPDLIDLLFLDNPAFKRKFAGTPIVRAKRRGLLRNVCVALGNIGTANALSALERAALDSEALIAEHAQWAIQQLRARGSMNCLDQMKKRPKQGRQSSWK